MSNRTWYAAAFASWPPSARIASRSACATQPSLRALHAAGHSRPTCAVPVIVSPSTVPVS
jgi:hypothetical protein